MEYVRMPQSDYKDIADAVRLKTGGAALLTSGEIADEIAAMSVVTAADNGKVVVNGALAAQTSKNISGSGTHDTTTNNSVTVPAGTEGTPTATKGTPSGGSVTVTPSVTNVAGYIAGGTQTGTPVTVSASELVSGTETITDTAQHDVTTKKYAQVSDANLAAGNIKSGVSILGVTGSYQGSGGVTPSERSDVNFLDYDGSVVASYTASEFASLTALPDNPVHTGLTAQGWNWPLASAKTYVAKYGKLDIGQMYTTSDGNTRIYICLEKGRLAPYLGLAVNGTATVDWGDGSATSTVTGSSITSVVNTQHTYASAGSYTISVSVSGSMAMVGVSPQGSRVIWGNSSTDVQNRVYQNAIKKVEIGANCSVGIHAFRFCYGLKYVTIPKSVTSLGNYAFATCYSLKHVTVPDSVTQIPQYAFYSCVSLETVAMPDSLTDISTKVWQSNGSATVSLTIPEGPTSLGEYLCYRLYALSCLVIPSTVTSIGQYAFTDCQSLSEVTIPAGVTSIAAGSFSGCTGLGVLKFLGSTPPAVANANAWTNLPTDCTICIPQGSRSAYTGAANYPSSGTYTYVEY